jgi:hypothetical protein
MVKSKLLVYVSGPLTNGMANVEERYVEDNIAEAIRIATWLVEKGFVPYVPHLTWYWHQRVPDIPYEAWLCMCEEFIRRCDAVYRIDGVSKGADHEVEFAQKLGLPVFTVQAQLLEWWAMERKAGDYSG